MPNEKDEKGGRWITTDNGVHVYIKPGQTKKQAIEEKFGKHNSYNRGDYYEAEMEYTRKYHPEEYRSVYVGKGESNEEAVLKKFGDYNSLNKKYFEPEGGFQNEVRHSVYTGKWNEENARYGYYDDDKTTVSYKGETGTYNNMMEKYGRTAIDVLRGKSQSKAEVAEREHVKERIMTQANMPRFDFSDRKNYIDENGNHYEGKLLVEGEKWFWDNYRYEREYNAVDKKDVDKPTYTENVYNKKGSLVASVDSTGRHAGDISKGMGMYEYIPHNVGTKEERKDYRQSIVDSSIMEFNRKYSKGVNYNSDFSAKRITKPATKPNNTKKKK